MSWIEDRFFTRATGKQYEIIGTISTGPLSHEAVDIIKSLETGKVRYIRRMNLFALLGGESKINYLNEEEVEDLFKTKDEKYP